jgi:hypothetical protein
MGESLQTQKVGPVNSIKIMNAQSLNRMAMGGLMIALAVVFAGCASSGYRRGQQISSALQSSADRIESRLTEQDLAVTSLNDLVNNPQADLRPQLKKFSAALGKPGALASSIREADQGLQERGKIYFEEWDKALATIQNEAIRSRGQARKQEVLIQYDAVRNSCLRVQTQLSPIESDLQDVHRFLEADLTLGGLTAIKSGTARVNRLASPVHDAVTRLVSDMRALGQAMSPQNITPQNTSK